MTFQINNGLKKIAVLLLTAGIIMGLVSPAACDEFYNNLQKLNGRPYAISSMIAGAVPDCIAESESGTTNLYRSEVKQSRNARANQFRITGTGSSFSFYISVINTLFMLLPAALLLTAVLSYHHIIFIHLKDGNK